MYLLNRHHTILFLAIAFLIVGTLACTQKSDTIEVYRKATYQVYESFNPHRAISTAEQSLSNLIYDSLFTVTGYLEIKPVLVDNWNLSEDGKTYTFILKRNIFFHDWGGMEATDVIASLQRIQTTDSYMKKFFSIIEKMQVVEKYKFSIQIKKAYPPFLALLASPAAKIFRASKTVGENPGYPIGSGSFKFKKVVTNHGHKVAILERNEKYHLGAPKIQTLELWEVDEAHALELARTGIIHDTSIFTSTTDYTGTEKMALTEAPAPSTWLFSFNTAKAPTANLKLRKCFAQAFKKEEFVKTYLHGHKVATGYLPPNLLGYKEMKDQHPVHDCQEFMGQRLVLDFPIEINDAQKMCQWITDNHLDFKIKCNLIKFEQVLERIPAKKSELSFLSMNLEHPDVEYFFTAFEKDSAFNLSNYSSKFVEDSIAKARGTTDRFKRQEIYTQLNEHIFNQVVTLNISYPGHRSFRHTCVKGFEINLAGESFIDYGKISLKSDCAFPKDFTGATL